MRKYLYNNEEIKNYLLEYSNDEDNSFDGNLEKLEELARSIHEFSSKYRKKPRKVRRNSMQNPDIRLGKIELPGRASIASDM